MFEQDEINKMRACGIHSIGTAVASSTMRATSNENITHSRVRLQTRLVDDVEFPTLSFWPALTCDYLNTIRIDERLASIVQYFLGPDVKQLNNQFYFRLPGDGDEFAWHQDLLFRIPEEDFPGIQSAYLQTMIVIDEMTADNGAVEYIFGSHTRGDLKLLPRDAETPSRLRKFKRDELRGVKVFGKPGDVIIWSVMTVHGSEANRSSRPRMTYMNGFSRADASKHFPWYLADGKVIQRLDMSSFPEYR